MPERKRVLVTAGNTREMIDPVRYLSNVSTGVMGFEIARAAERAGCLTTLITGPTHLKPPSRVKCIRVTDSRELETAVRREFTRADVLFMTSAVCDFRPARRARRKIKRKAFLRLKLVATPDILKGLARKKGKQTVVGFCLETERLLENARRKLREKSLDFIVANFLGPGYRPFGSHRTSITLLGRGGMVFSLRRAPKREVARFLLEKIIGTAR